MKTAEEIMDKHNLYPESAKKIIVRDAKEGSNFDRQKAAMIEFAKQHVEAALKAANENATLIRTTSTGYPTRYSINEESITNAYPLTNIK